ncbi:OmpA family protein [Crocinitomicaceae bacterium]|nr:OmpA family protein [Crocinitomicaceae bacterium]
MKMRNLILSITLGMLSVFTFAQDDAQNLVPNGSFESVEKKPKRLGKIESATGWVSPTGSRADLFVSSKMPEIDVPLNIYGKEVAKEGENYAGIVAYSYGDKLKRSYLMIKLESPLKKGMRYCVKYNASLSEASKYASNNVGAKLSKKAFGTDSKLSIIEDASILHFNNDNKIFSARYNWTEVCGMFRSEGGEKFITIGNFSSNDDTKSERMKKDTKVKVAQIVAAYYYIDDVSVKLLAEGDVCDCLADEGNDEYSTLIYQRVVNVTDDMSSNEKVNMQKVFFAFGKSKLTTQGQTTLNFIAEQLQANPEAKIELLGHNNQMEDSVGVTNAYYADMDSKRIGTVMKYLMSKGIAESSIIVSMKGDSIKNEELLEEDDAELKMAKNRRVTFKFRD